MSSDPLEDATEAILADDEVYKALEEVECAMRADHEHYNMGRHKIVELLMKEIRDTAWDMARENLSNEAAMGEVADSISVYRPPPGGRTGGQ